MSVVMPRKRAADVRPMRHAAREADQLAFVEDRHREGHVVEMAAGDVGVVGQLAYRPASMFSMPKCAIFALTVSLMPRMNIGRPSPIDTVSPSRVEQPDGEIERLVDDHVVGGAHQIGLHLLGRGDEADCG